MRQGVRLGIDVGKARIGVSRSDRDGLLATPVETVPRSPAAAPPTSGDLETPTADLRRIAEIAAELEPFEVVVGLPLSLSGASTESTEDARRFAAAITRALRIPVRLVDERLSTVSAQASLHRSGRKTKGSRTIIDQVAAVIILQHALDSERSSGTEPGELVVRETEQG